VGASPTTDTRFRRIFDEHFEAVTRYCLRRLPAADVNDATAEVFLVAWKKIDRVPAGDDALPWLYGVARNVVRNVDRSSRRSSRVIGKLAALSPPPVPGPEPQVIRRQEDAELIAALERMKSEDQEVLRLRAYEGLTAPEIAVVLGVSSEAAKKRVARALGRLRKVVELADSGEWRREVLPEGGDS